MLRGFLLALTVLVVTGAPAAASVQLNAAISKTEEAPAIQSTCTMLPNTGLRGGDCPSLLKLQVATAAECCSACQAHPQCTQWTLNPKDTPSCHLKTGPTPPKGCVVQDAACTSGYLTAPPPPPSPPTPPPTRRPTPPPVPAPRPHIIAILQDDLGFFDTGIRDPSKAELTSNITALAREGVVLDNHYTHWHCSPTRRSFITGRLAIHHSEDLSAIEADDIDLRWTWISEKMASAGYQSYWFGKGHTGYKSWAHLPASRGFSGHYGFLSGAQSYTSDDRWNMTEPSRNNTEYSTDLYGELAVQAVAQHDPSVPLFLYLPFQAVHTPYDPVPHWSGNVYSGMIWDADQRIGQLVAALKANGMWNNTLIYYTSDNGGVVDGINYPLRGEKHSNWEGGFRTASFFSGGFLPEKVRGTHNNITFHVVDAYPTFCALAGVYPHDDPPEPPLPVDPSNPQKDIWGNHSFPGLDGTNIWPMISNPEAYANNISAAHAALVLSKEVIIAGEFKLLVSQPKWKTDNNGWKQPNGTWEPSNDKDWPCSKEDLYFNDWHLPVATGGRPCLFNIRNDTSERTDLAPNNPELVNTLWRMLNNTILTTFHSRSPAALLGPCNEQCAKAKWASFGKGGDGPICGVPGCE